ncbi:hypothetical protein ACLGIH_18705 [Streptomyces sp. HMX87]|uniref:hypothetical protein n=1 Tax=Streptomyces sp. HMX87 TaxID=3390849 RepID=UPI003A89DF6E
MGVLLVPRGTHRRTGPRPAHLPLPPPPPTIDIPPLPAHRSPYGLPTVLDGAATVAVRPYVTACRPYELREAA